MSSSARPRANPYGCFAPGAAVFSTVPTTIHRKDRCNTLLTIIHGADFHLDSPFSGLSPQRAAQRRGEQRQLLSALAGPGCNLLLAALFCRLPGGSLFAGLNLALALFNLLPIGALDGGRVLRAALNWLVSPQAGDRVCPPLERALAGCLLSFGAFLAGAGGSVTLLITAIWLFSSLSWEKEGKRGCHMGRKRVK